MKVTVVGVGTPLWSNGCGCVTWLGDDAVVEKNLSDEEKKLIESLGGWEKLMETLKQRLEEQKGSSPGR